MACSAASFSLSSIYNGNGTIKGKLLTITNYTNLLKHILPVHNNHVGAIERRRGERREADTYKLNDTEP